jgi:hypothetical protein
MCDSQLWLAKNATFFSSKLYLLCHCTRGKKISGITWKENIIENISFPVMRCGINECVGVHHWGKKSSEIVFKVRIT